MEGDEKEIGHLRIALSNFYKLLEGTGEDLTSGIGKDFKKYTMVAHLLNLKYIYDKKNIGVLSAKISIALLRYSDLIRLDKLYLEAG